VPRHFPNEGAGAMGTHTNHINRKSRGGEGIFFYNARTAQQETTEEYWRKLSTNILCSAVLQCNTNWMLFFHQCLLWQVIQLLLLMLIVIN